ncbi:sensor histidine kinase [Clostridium gasigenes]|uniref:ATP-binding protein n=1 Tax=Clostridium gasigenes TaxID=94869 RepID=UPI00143841BF|nr:sensor histidine kinase [Clostridium gasigenes]NKF08837.1 HAMP domain-containing histidine kinase [Clostridium gasigenes]QSW21251.1 sensor histidine kinase [Clostridium gasigenes]
MDILILFVDISFIIVQYFKEKSICTEIKGNGVLSKNTIKNDFLYNCIYEIIEDERKEFYIVQDIYKNKLKEVDEFVTQSVHDIKIDISVCELIVDEFDDNDILVNRIECIKYKVNEILAVTRSNSFNNDIFAQRVNINEVIKKAIKENYIFFISKNISINNESEKFMVISDMKWVQYIISQILNNCTKYVKEYGEVRIYTKEEESVYHLYIEDNGVGISGQDIGRIFEKSFTGENGRKNIKSTGMGLYYVKKICKQLKINIKVESEKNVYTRVELIFKKS